MRSASNYLAVFRPAKKLLIQFLSLVLVISTLSVISIAKAPKALGATNSTLGSAPCVQSLENTTGVDVFQNGTACVVKFTYAGNNFGQTGTNIWKVPANISNIQLLLVGGGGAGGGGIGGGGGAGEYVRVTNLSVSAGNEISVGVGNGGYNNAWAPGNAGENSSFGDVTAFGGGGGGTNESNGPTASRGLNGSFFGSGGGGGYPNLLNTGSNARLVAVSTRTITSGSAFESAVALKQNGGSGSNGGSQFATGGGGGGAIQVGTAGNSETQSGGKGGDGYPNSITGTSVDYAAGGGGGVNGDGAARSAGQPGAGGTGGGGAGGPRDGSLVNNQSGVDGTANTGGGGGGASNAQWAGRGGSGVVIVRYEYESYSVTLNAGAGSGSNQVLTKALDVSLTLPNSSTANSYFTRTGYTVTGWSTTNGGAQDYALSSSYTANSPTTLYPVWTANSRTLSFDANGGTGSAPAVAGSKSFAETITSPLNTFTREGFSFASWNTQANGSGTQYAGNGVTTFSMPDNDVTFYAQWTKIKTAGLVVNLDATNLQSLPSSSFTWTSILPGTSSSSQNPGNNNNIQLNIMGPRSFFFSGSGSYYKYAHKEDTALNTAITVEMWIQPDSFRSDFTLLSSRWFADDLENGSSSTQDWHFAIRKDVNSNYRLNLFTQASPGQYKESYGSHRFTAGQGKWFLVGFTIDNTNNGNLKFYVNGRQDGPTITGINRSGLTASNLVISDARGATSSFLGSLSKFRLYSNTLSSAEMLSNFDAEKSTFSASQVVPQVTFNSNYGTPTTSTQLLTNNVEGNLAANTFTRAGYTFSGWDTVNDGSGTDYTDSQSVTLTSDLTLFAKWTLNTQTVTFNANNGSGATSTQTITDNTATNLNANTFTRAGYTFAGWHTNNAGTGGTDYSNNQSVTLTSSLTLFAKWTEVGCTKTETASGDYTIERITQTGSCVWTTPTGVTAIEVAVIGGGGGGGFGDNGGGGGAGEVLVTGSSATLTSPTNTTINSTSTISTTAGSKTVVTIGVGGTSGAGTDPASAGDIGTWSFGGDGGASSFGGVTANGGGGGGGGGRVNGAPGGSGGGGANGGTAGVVGTNATPSGWTSFRNPGAGASFAGGGGAGGAGLAGEGTVSSGSRNGGLGITLWGNKYAGGGGGGGGRLGAENNANDTVLGGNGRLFDQPHAYAGTSSNTSAGVANTGTGGGSGAPGGSGVVIIRYANQSQSAPSGLAGVAPSTFGASDGSITGTTTAMEYKLSGAGSYTSVAGTSVTGLLAGTYLVRFTAKTGFNAGADATVTIAAGPNATQSAPTDLAGVAPSTFGASDGKITGTTTAMEYKLSTGSTYTTASVTETTGLAAGTYDVRFAAKTGFNAGSVQTVTIAAGASVAINSAAIAGVTAPRRGAVPTSSITETAQYTATISWSDSPVNFLEDVVYTATITLTPKAGYTVSGVAANFFTVSGAAATNSANSGVISAIFPADRTFRSNGSDRNSFRVGAPGSAVEVIPINSSFTWEAWIKPTGPFTSGFRTILDNGDDGDNLGRAALYLRGSANGAYLQGGYFTTVGNGFWGLTKVGSIALDTWQHVAMVVSRGSDNKVGIKFYINGVIVEYRENTEWSTGSGYSQLVTANAVSGNLNSLGLIVGDTITSATQQFKGSIDQVKVWNGVLSDAQVATSRNTFSNSGISGVTLLAHYAFDDLGATPVLSDSTDNLASAETTYDLALTNVGLVPTLGTPISTANGFTVQITNYIADYTWTGTATAFGSVSISDTGLVTVTGVAPGTSSTATITNSRTGYAGGSATATASSTTGAALNPTFGTVTATADGFTVQITNYNASYTWGTPTVSAGSVTAGTPSGSNLLLTVTGLTAGQSATITQTTSRTGYSNGSATKDGTAFSNVATLSGLTISEGTLSPGFASGTTSYTASVANAISSLTVTPTKTNTNASIQVKIGSGSFASIASGSASSGLALSEGSNVITIKVTAQDGTTFSEYVITVTRLASAVAPSIGTQPVGVSKTVGQSVTFTVVATASDSGDLTYQWQKGGVNIAGATSDTYTFTTSSTSDAGNFQVVITNTKNSTTATTTSTAVALTMSSALTINTPNSGLSGTATSTFTSLTIVSSGGSGTNSFALISGTLPDGLSLNSGTGAITGTPTTVGDQAITVRVTDSNGATATTNSFTISISAAALSNATTPTVAATAGVLKSIDVSWTAVTNASSYTLKLYATNGSTLHKTIEGLSGTSRTITVSDFVSLADNTEYKVSITAIGAGNYSSSAESTKAAVTTATTFTLTYSYNGATGGNGTASSSYITGATALTLPTPSKTGYTLDGWYEASDLSGSKLSSTYSPTQTRTIYAKWTGDSYTITYDYNGANGENQTLTSPFTVGGTAITLPVPTRTAYTFDGWFEASALTGSALTGPYSPTQTRTIYAKWIADTYTITYDYNGADGANSTTDSSFTVAGTAITLPAPTRTGYSFDGWFEASALTGSALSGPYSPTQTRTIYAKWTANTQTITYAAGTGGSGTGPTTPVSVSYGSTFTTPANTYTRAGYSFAGWSDGTNVFLGGVTYPTSGSVSGNVTLTATWTANTLTVTFDSDGGSSVLNGSVVVGETLSAPTAPTKTGLNFVGWSATSGGAPVTFPYAHGATSDFTLYAIWTSVYTTGLRFYIDATDTSSLASNTATAWQSIAPATSRATGNPQGATVSASSNPGMVSFGPSKSVQYGVISEVAIAGDITVETWIKLPSDYTKSNSNQVIATHYFDNTSNTATNNSIDWYWFFTDGRLKLTIGNGSGGLKTLSGASVIATSFAGSWIHVAFVQKQNGDVTHYFNGKAAGSATGGYVRRAVTNTRLTLGVGNNQSMNASMSKFRIYSGALTIEQLQGNMNSDASTFSRLLARTLTIDSGSYSSSSSTPPTLTATSSAGTGSKTFTSSTTSICTVNSSSGVVAFVTAGTCTVSAAIAADSTYDAATSASISFTAVGLAITYNSKGGSSVTSGATVNGGAIAAAPTAPTLANYTFAGWSATDGGTAVTFPFTHGKTASFTMYALWTANQYTLTYVYNSATGGNSTTTDNFTTGGSAIVLPTPTRTGYTFDGWFSNAALTSSIGAAGGSYSPSGTSLTPSAYAKWVAVNYTVTYATTDSSSGAAPTDSANYNIGNNVTIKANSGSLARTGYSLAGWTAASDGTGTVLTSGTTYTTASSNMTFYPKWSANTYTITYNANGATGNPAASSATYTTAGSSVTLTAVGTMAKTGFDFAGWSESPTGTVLSGGYTTAANITLYAIWTIKNISITFDKGLASGVTVSNFPANTSLTYGSTLTLAGNITSTVVISGAAYAFVGWSKSGNIYGGGDTFLIGESAPTFVAEWVKIFAVRYALNGGTAAANSSEVDAECTYVDGNDLRCIENQSITTNAAPSRAGYTFAGWVNQGDQAVASASTTVITSTNYLFYANWTAIDYAITYNTDGGSVAPTETTKQIGQTFTVAAAPTKTGYNFAGWSDSTSVYGAGVTYIVGSSAVTLTAQWTPKVYTIVYDWNGGSGSSTANDSYTVGNSGITLPVQGDHIKDGYTFGGWSLTDSGSVISGAFTPTADTTLYAIWNVGTYTLTYNANGGTVSTASATIVNGSSLTLPTPTRANFVFEGWYSASTGGVSIGAAGANFQPAQSRSIYARWTQASLYGLSPSILTRIGTLAASDGSDSTFTNSNANSSVSVVVPDGALPAGTNVYFDRVGDFARAQSVIAGTNSYIISLVVSWLALDGTVPNTNAGKSISVTISNASIKAGASVYGIVAGNVTLLGTATQNGTVTVQLTSDPEVVVVATKPAAPTNLAVTTVNDQADLTWTAPSSDGGSEITEYTVSGTGGVTCTTTNTSCTITGLSSGTAYTFTVTATNALGTSPVSTSAGATTASRPDAPTSVTASADGTRQSVISWTAPVSDGGSAITGYTATANGGATCTTLTTSCTITGLADDTTYTFTVVATNLIGTSDASGTATARTAIAPVSGGGGSGGGGGGSSTPSTPAEPVVPTTPVKSNVTVAPSVTVVGDVQVTVPTVEVTVPVSTPEVKPPVLTLDANSVKFIAEVKIVEGKLVLIPETGFSGKRTVTVTITQNGAERFVQIPLIVLPEPVAKPVLTPTTVRKSIIRWSASDNAETYSVFLNSKRVCATAATTCSVSRLLGPDSRVEVLSNGGDRTVSDRVKAEFKQNNAVVVTRIVSATITKRALTKVDTKALDKVISLIKSQGFGTIVISEITTTKKTAALAAARIAVIKKYISSKSGSEKINFEVVPAASRTYFNNISVKG